MKSRLEAKYERILQSLSWKQEVLESLRPNTIRKEAFQEKISNWLREEQCPSNSQKPVSRIEELRSFIASQYHLLKSRKLKRGQDYLQKVLKAIRWAKNRIQTLVSEGLEEDSNDVLELNHKETIKLAYLEVEKSRQELLYLRKDLERLLDFDSPSPGHGTLLFYSIAQQILKELT